MKMKTMVRQVITGAATVVAMATLPGAALAGPINGFLAISGGVTYDTVGNTGNAILDWAPTGTGFGNGFVVTNATGYFNPDGAGVAGIDVVTQLQIRDVTGTLALSGAAPLPAYAPAGPVNVPNFLSNFVQIPNGADNTIAPLTNLHFDLTEMVRNNAFPMCTGAETEGDTCVLGEIFVLTETEDGLRINLDVRGFFRNAADEGFFMGAFSTTFTGLTFQGPDGAYAKLAAGTNLDCPDGAGGRTACSFDASFSNAQPIPEPASLLLFGTGSTLLALRRRRNKK